MVLLLLGAAAAYAPLVPRLPAAAYAPLVTRMPAARGYNLHVSMALIPSDLETICRSDFKGRSKEAFERDTSDVAALWSALVAAYGSETLALQACRQNPQVVNPLYTSHYIQTQL